MNYRESYLVETQGLSPNVSESSMRNSAKVKRERRERKKNTR